MKRIRRAFDGAIVALVMKPVARWLIARTRRRATEYAYATVVVPAQGFLQTAMPGPVAGGGTAEESTLDEAAEELVERDVVRTVFIAGTVIAIVAGCALILAALIRSRRRATTPEPVATPRELVAIPIEVPTDRPAEPLGQRAPSEDELRSITGIGPEMSKRLRRVGITSVGQIAAWSPYDIREIAERIELDAERIEDEDWVGQAQAAVGATSAAI